MTVWLCRISRERRRSRASWWLAILIVACALRVEAQISSSAFDAANKLYEQGKFVEAAAGYEKLLQSGQASEALYFNWGNALFKAGQIGRAIAAYERGEQIAPRDPDVRANLQFARNQVQGPTLLPDKLWRWLGKLSLNEWTWLASAALWLWFILLTLLQWRPVLRPALRSYAAWIGAVAVVLCACFAGAFYFAHWKPRAIIVAPEAVARQAPLDESQSAFTLHDGAELEVLDQKDLWLQVQVDPRRIGWVRRDSVLTVPAG
jgi:tetratricopeptide (TPR) repeat protein